MGVNDPQSHFNDPHIVESVLQEDQRDHPPLPFGTVERRIATTLLFLAAIPSLVIPSLSKLWNKTTQFALLLSLFCLVGLYFVVQYRFQWILQLTHTLQNIYHERIRI